MQIWKPDRTRKFRRRILQWYGRHRRRLPWREDPSPYRVWISEVMLQQTRARTVVPYFERFLRRFPDLGELASAREREVLSLWSGLGYYRRARNLHRAAREIVKRHSGRFPETFEAMVRLPGIGRYTASAIESIAFHRARPVVDANVRRVMTRLDGLHGRVREQLYWDQASAWVSPRRPGDFNQAVMELGALICTPVRPDCPACPVRTLCRAYRDNAQGRLRLVRRRRAAERAELAVAVIACGRRILIARQPPASFVPGVWGLPSCERAAGRCAEEDALALAKNLAGMPVSLARVRRIRHAITHRRITADVFYGVLQAPTSAGGGRWVTRKEFAGEVTSSLFHKALRAAERSAAAHHP